MSSPFPARSRTLPVLAVMVERLMPTWDTGRERKRCADCNEPIEPNHFVTQDLAKFVPPNQTKRVYHYDCADPVYQQGWDVAHEDGRIEAGRGHKADVDTYYYRRKQKR